MIHVCKERKFLYLGHYIYIYIICMQYNIYNVSYFNILHLIYPVPLLSQSTLTVHLCTSLHGDIEEGNGTPRQYSCLENPMDGGAC